MKSVFCLAVVAALSGGVATAQDVPASFARTPAVAKGVASYPRLQGEGPVIAKINAALAKGDGRVKKAAKRCHADGGERSDWARTVDVTLKGPRFVSYVSHDAFFCGGAHPDDSTMALVYDLTSGVPVDWKTLLPPELAESTGTSTGGDDTTLGTVGSAKLSELYIKAIKPEDIDPDCADVLKQSDLHFILWPDAKAGGLTLQQTDLPHAAAACGPQATIPLATLRELGVDATLLEEIEAGQGAAK